MKIGELARRFDVPIETIRYYERENLLPLPHRTASNYRVYGPAHADRLGFIINCRALDMTLDEIRMLLMYHDRPSENCDEVARLLDEHVGHVADRITELRRLQRQLRTLRSACRHGRSTKSCGILRSLGEEQTLAAHPRASHMRRRGV